MKFLIKAFFNGSLSTERGTSCAVGTLIYTILGYRVRDWFIITDAIRNGAEIPDGMTDLAKSLDDLISLNDLVALEDAFHKHDLPLLDRIRAVKRLNPDILV